MDRKNLKMMVNLTGGVGRGLDQAVRDYDAAHPGRFLTFTEPWWVRTADKDYAAFQADEIERAHRAGARGVKVLKTLGLYLRSRVATGTLITIDDPRFDPMWETCGATGHSRRDSHLAIRGLLPAHRSLQRAVRGAAQPSGLVVSRKRLSGATAN